jgi:hypothetical protein
VHKFGSHKVSLAIGAAIACNRTAGGRTALFRISEMNEKLEAIRTISNRLLIALGVLVALFIPAAIYVYLHPESVLISTPLMALAVGFIGGFVGLQRRVKQMSDDDITLLANSWVYICLAPLVGGILAVLTYVLFISGLLAGNLFPKFVPDASSKSLEGLAAIFQVHGDAADYAKLIFWCFVAGFSERFVTDIISRFDSSASEDGKPATAETANPSPSDA